MLYDWWHGEIPSDWQDQNCAKRELLPNVVLGSLGTVRFLKNDARSGRSALHPSSPSAAEKADDRKGTFRIDPRLALRRWARPTKS